MEYPIAYNNGKHCCNKFEEFTPGKNLLTMATDSCNAMATESCNGNCQKCPVQGMITSGVQSVIVKNTSSFFITIAIKRKQKNNVQG